MRLTWPLTGRSEELRRIHDVIADSDLCGVVVRGAAGVGKSRLAREALAAATADGHEARWVVATSSSRGIPMGAFAPWADSVDGDDPQLLHLVRGVIDAMTTASGDRPVVVGVDDVHLLDELSTFVLHQIVLRRAAKVILTIRDGEPIPQGVPDIWAAAPFDRLDLQPLSQEQAGALVAAALDGGLHPDALQRLWALTRGNVLYLRNIVDREVADGRLFPQGELWRWSGDPVVPPGLAELIESRIGTLPPAVGEVVDVLAVGEPLALRSLVRIIDDSAVEAADVRGLITLENDVDTVHVRLAHPLYGEVRRRGAAQTRLRRLRGLVATELAESADRDDIRVVVHRATMALESDLAPDAELFVRAAQGAVWLGDLPLAVRLASAAADAGAGAEANLIRAHMLTWLSRGEEAEAVLAASLTGALTDAEWGRLIFLRGQNMLFALADPDGAKRLIDEAAQTIPVRNQGCIDAIRTVYWSLTGKPEQATVAFRQLDVDQLPAIVGAGTAMAYSVAAADSGRTDEAVAAAETAYRFANQSMDAAQMRFVIADGHISALVQSGRLAEAAAVAQQMSSQAADLPGVQLMSDALAGLAALGGGQAAQAYALLEPTVSALSGTTVGWGYRYRLPYTVALAMRGRADEAAQSLATLIQQRHPSWGYLDYELALARGWVALAGGAVSEAIATVRAGAESARKIGGLAAEAVSLQIATQFGDRTTAPRLRQLETLIEGPRIAVTARFANALHSGDANGLSAASTAFEDIGDLVAAIDAAAHAASAYRKDGKRGSALGCSTRAEALADRCDVVTPALMAAAEPLPLTARELEIARLLAQQLSTKAVSDRLHLSLRTIEGHIYRAMKKTGVATRDELVELVRRRTRTAND